MASLPALDREDPVVPKSPLLAMESIDESLLNPWGMLGTGDGDFIGAGDLERGGGGSPRVQGWFRASSGVNLSSGSQVRHFVKKSRKGASVHLSTEERVFCPRGEGGNQGSGIRFHDR